MASYEKQGESDEWYTPAYIFEALGVMFDLDVACPPEGPRHVPAKYFYSEKSLEREWSGFVWMNPPFGHQNTKRLWLRKFFEHGNGIALLPDRTSAPWWQEFARMQSEKDVVLFVSPKVKFEIPEWEIPSVRRMSQAGLTPLEISKRTRFSVANVKRIIKGEDVVEAPGTTLISAGPKGVAALLRASSLGVAFHPARRTAA
ncbi:phage N-6-adenine-methyltransferase [Phaeobacter inhibens]|uniref:phage N-6-adenine-methyltransferase n=1 Tax=Phaeobacter inhibens TaxID=221822 RepID=UPI0021A5A8E7|nr:phage N-6-adenine-methyltransferase [Phaeobacter inhibens]UWS06785.1 phage N-6-adenine-methyltransferase [Phaeobacter inhibens]